MKDFYKKQENPDLIFNGYPEFNIPHPEEILSYRKIYDWNRLN